jgi:hypothetical protein
MAALPRRTVGVLSTVIWDHSQLISDLVSGDLGHSLNSLRLVLTLIK